MVLKDVIDISMVSGKNNLATADAVVQYYINDSRLAYDNNEHTLTVFLHSFRYV